MKALIAFLIYLLMASHSYAKTEADSLSVIKVGAQNAQEQCYMKIHFDTFDFQSCIMSLSQSTKQSSLDLLGIYYFGYVGGMDAVRTGMYGSSNTAYFFLKKFRSIQKKLHIDNESLCSVIPGNCDIRVAQMIAMEKSPKPKPVDPDGAVPAGPQHVH